MASREQLYEKDPYCYWCGKLTKLNGRDNDPDLATLEHIRSRFWQRRTNPTRTPRSREAIPHSNGIVVLACFHCNNLRGRIEAEFFSRLTQPPKPPKPRSELRDHQGELLAAIVKFLGNGGELSGEGADEVLHWAGLVYDGWEKRRQRCRYA